MRQRMVDHGAFTVAIAMLLSAVIGHAALNADQDSLRDMGETAKLSVAWHVDANNTGAQDGLSWGSAFTDIQSAVDAAHDGGGGEVSVVAGT